MTAPGVADAERDWVLSRRPTLKPQVAFVPQVHRGRTWYLLHDPLSGTHLLLDRPAFEFVSALTGKATVTELLTAADLDADDAIALLTTLSDAELLLGELGRSPQDLLERDRTTRNRQRRQQWLRPLSIRVPLLDPDALLRRLLPLANLVFSRLGLLVWLVIVGWAGLTAVREAAAIGVHWASRFMDPANLVALVLLYPLVKGIHELGHGLAARRWGAEVHEMGIMLLVFMPVPYVDASATSAFRVARHRMVVAGAGILTELLLSATALLLFTQLETGLLRDLMFDVAIIGGVSTLLFNGNPLLRFDGYYVLMDALQIPNLGPRAQRLLGHLLRRYLLGLQEPAPEADAGERAWLLAYGVASGIYRLVISFTIALFVGSQFFFVGSLLACWFLWQQFVSPTVNGVLRALPLVTAAGRLPRLILLTVMVMGGVSAGLFAVPVPSSTVAQGIIAPPEQSLVRAGASGFIVSLPVQTGDLITPNTTLLQLSNDDLLQDERRLEARLAELEAMRVVARATDRSEAQRFGDDIISTSAQLQRVRDERAQLTLTATVDGRMSWSPGVDRGRFVERGEVLGYVTNAADWRVKALVPQHAMGRLEAGVLGVELAAWGSPASVEAGAVSGQTPLAVQALPHRVMGTQGGGAIAVDTRDEEGIRLLKPMFEVEVQLQDPSVQRYRIGQRFVVRFEHASEPIGYRTGAWLRRTVDERLNL